MTGNEIICQRLFCRAACASSAQQRRRALSALMALLRGINAPRLAAVRPARTLFPAGCIVGSDTTTSRTGEWLSYDDAPEREVTVPEGSNVRAPAEYPPEGTPDTKVGLSRCGQKARPNRQLRNPPRARAPTTTAGEATKMPALPVPLFPLIGEQDDSSPTFGFKHERGKKRDRTHPRLTRPQSGTAWMAGLTRLMLQVT